MRHRHRAIFVHVRRDLDLDLNYTATTSEPSRPSRYMGGLLDTALHPACSVAMSVAVSSLLSQSSTAAFRISAQLVPTLAHSASEVLERPRAQQDGEIRRHPAP